MAGTRFTSNRADVRYRQGTIPYASNIQVRTPDTQIKKMVLLGNPFIPVSCHASLIQRKK
jgi:hypothetical protein